MKFGFAQINPTVGDIAGNTHLILEAIHAGEADGCDLVLFPELALPGYPPEDLLLRPAFIRDNLAALNNLARRVTTCAALVGFVDQKGGDRFNAAAWIQGGRIAAVYHKQHLPNYGVFDEQRYFKPGRRFLVRAHKGIRVGVTICEDIWGAPSQLKGLKARKPNVIVNLSASPFHVNKATLRHEVAARTARALRAPLLYCNLLGGQDELVFDGGSFAVAPSGSVKMEAPFFKPGLYPVSIEIKKSKAEIVPSARPAAWAAIEQIHEALVLGTRDYVQKNGFQKVALGLSGGIDSALVAALAVEAVGADHVIGVTMPSRYNSAETRSDAGLVAKNLGMKFLEIPIQATFESYLTALKPLFDQTEPNIAEENLQARVRGTLLMALSNKFNWLILTTGNKSEMSTGYCTLYGDTAGGFAVLKDVLKTTVYDLARFINRKNGRDVIPTATIERAPSAELKHGQKDEDSLGPYAELDPIIVGYVENNLPLGTLVSKLGQPESQIRRVVSLIDRNEYKRRQAPPGIKITPRSFGRDHRMPITNRYTQS